MTPEEFRTHCQRTRHNDQPPADRILNAALGLGEAGEVQNLIKKWFFHEHPMDEITPKILDELGDIMYYVDWLSDSLGLTISQIMEFNVEKLKKRYPNGWEAERSIHRSE